MSLRSDQLERFFFHGNAFVVGGQMVRPYSEIIETEGSSVLPMVGGGADSQVVDYNYRDLITFRMGHSKVLGNVDEVAGKRIYNTLATAWIEDLNIAGIITADRVVARLVSEKSEDDTEIPILPVGSYIRNLRIAGQAIQLQEHLELFTLPTIQDIAGHSNAGLLDSTRSTLDIPELASQQASNGQLLFDDIRVLTSIFGALKNLPAGTSSGTNSTYPWAVHIPGFGTVYFGEYLISRYARRLTMIRVCMGSPEEGEVQLVSTEGNGCTYP